MWTNLGKVVLLRRESFAGSNPAMGTKVKCLAIMHKEVKHPDVVADIVHSTGDLSALGAYPELGVRCDTDGGRQY